MTPLILGVAFGTGVLLVASGLIGTRPRLTVLLAHLDEPPTAGPPVAPRTIAGRIVGTRLTTTTLGERFADQMRGELHIAGSSPAELFGAMTVGAAAALAGLLIVASVATGGAAQADPGLLGIIAIGSVVAGAAVPILTLRRRARRHRRAFRHALSCYLDLVAIGLAGGAGIDTALTTSVDAGHGWAFVRLRDALRAARLAGEPPWQAFAQLGDDLAIEELRELAASMALAGSEGARVRTSLLTKARAMRTRALTDTERHAQAASERMALPIVVLMAGFVVFLGYPALIHVVAGI